MNTTAQGWTHTHLFLAYCLDTHTHTRRALSVDTHTPWLAGKPWFYLGSTSVFRGRPFILNQEVKTHTKRMSAERELFWAGSP